MVNKKQILRPAATGLDFPSKYYFIPHPGGPIFPIKVVPESTTATPPQSFEMGDEGPYQQQFVGYQLQSGEQLVASSSAVAFQVPDPPLEEYVPQLQIPARLVTNPEFVGVEGLLWSPASTSQLQGVAGFPTVTLMSEEGPNPTQESSCPSNTHFDGHVYGSPDKQLSSFGELHEVALAKSYYEEGSQAAPEGDSQILLKPGSQRQRTPEWLSPDKCSSSSGFGSTSASSTVGLGGDEDDDIQVIVDAGKQPPFPLEPKWSREFEASLVNLQKDPKPIRDLAETPPVTLRNRSGSGRRANKSYCYITVEDLSQVVTEIDKIVGTWSEMDQRELKTNPAASILQLNLHSKLIADILTAKMKCIRQARDLNQITERVQAAWTVQGMIKKPKKQNDPDEDILRCFHWQGLVVSGCIRQERSTTYIKEKCCRWSRLGIDAPITPMPSSSRKRKEPSRSPAKNSNPKKTCGPRKVKALTFN